jgi:topoisomerase IA-like protein
MVRQNNGYSASELLCFDKSRLGDYKDVGVHIRTGKFGAYIEHGDAKFNLGCPKPLKDITLDDAIRIIDGVDSFTADPRGW